MNEVTEKDRHHETDWCPVSVHGPSQPESKGLTPETTRPLDALFEPRERRLWTAQQPTGGSESVERAKRASAVLPSPVGPGRGTSDRMEGGPTGTTDLLCGRCGGGGAYRTLHYAAAMVNGAESSDYSQSIPGMGGSA